jgi:hypothetical protein
VANSEGGPDKKKDYLALYDAKCKRCGHLDPAEKTRFVQCHFSKGNSFCPASEVQLVVIGGAYKLARQCLRARDGRDAKAEADILTRVARESEAFQERFYAELENPTTEKRK